MAILFEAISHNEARCSFAGLIWMRRYDSHSYEHTFKNAVTVADTFHLRNASRRTPGGMARVDGCEYLKGTFISKRAPVRSTDDAICP